MCGVEAYHGQGIGRGSAAPETTFYRRKMTAHLTRPSIVRDQKFRFTSRAHAGAQRARLDRMSVLIVLLVVVAAIAALQGGQFHNPLRYRSCQSRRWRRAFPSASRKDIRDFLSLVVSSFSFSDSDRLRIRPDDELLGIVRAAQPQEQGGVEALVKALRVRYGVKLADVWHEGLTVGELFRDIQAMRSQRAAA